MASKDFIVAIELGSSKITGIAGKKNLDGSIQVLACVKEDSTACIRKGVVYNIDKTAQCLTSIVDLTDTIYDVRDRLDALVAANRGDQPKNFLDKLAAFVFKVPGLPSVIVALVKLLDRYGICPRALIDELPFHAGLYITNTASIGLHDVNHHIYNFGNVGMFFSIGMTERVAVVENGQARMRRFMPIGIVVDERVCSGAHYARFFNDMRRYLDHPELLVEPPESVRFDPGCEYHQPKPSKG